MSAAAAEPKTQIDARPAPLADWKLPAEFATMRRLLEARMGKMGKREFVQVVAPDGGRANLLEGTTRAWVSTPDEN
jgi:hypothetical protein